MEEDEYLRRALEENLRLNEQRQRTAEETERRHREAEERALQESQASAARVRRATEDEEDQLRLAMERSAADEASRARQIEEARHRLLQMDREFGGGSGATRPANNTSRTGANGPGNNNNGSTARATPASTRSRSFSGRPESNAVRPERAYQPRRQGTAPSTATQAQAPIHRGRTAQTSANTSIRSRSATADRPQHTSPQAQPTSQPRRQNTAPSHVVPPAPAATGTNPPSRLNSIRRSLSRRLSHRQSPSPPSTNTSTPQPRAPPHPTPNPASYSLREILSRSVTDAFSFPAPEPSFDAALQAAINESAEQARDEEEEAVQRSRGVPTYEEACRMPRYRAPRGARYRFQGPKEVVLEGEGGGGGRVRVVGEMDLGEAMRVANQNVRRRGGG
ncbi:predicted protein [Uncinocarpus reesii 1704]|uniref:Uncharacterized protein n=1 Tax=Uncinocarpus reesii (strain UAMH 1704) TaxID=336963 RepID=C4JPL7_UNCRE|nr:uncharacterized protein UREG_03189 [Uncinocarpus reesii 1704]EEP78343.1 predicted protein [Uncinocarpus reesii 1704]